MSYLYLSNLAKQGRNSEFKEVVKERNFTFDSSQSCLVFSSAVSSGNKEIIDFIYNHHSLVKNEIWYDRTFQCFVDLLYDRTTNLFDFKNNFEILDYLLKNIDLKYDLNDYVIFVMLWDDQNINGIKFLLKHKLFHNVISKDWLVKHYYNIIPEFYKLVKVNNF